MILLKTHKHHTFMKRIVTTIVLMIFSVISSNSFAKPKTAGEYMLFLHPFFQNHNWQLSSDTIIFEVDDLFNPQSPKNVKVGGNDTTAWFIYDENNKVYLLKSYIQYPANQFQYTTVKTDAPTELAVLSADIMGEIVIKNSASINSPYYITCDSSNFTIMKINGTDKTISLDSTTNFDITQKIYALNSLLSDSTLDSEGSSLWVGGNQGLLCRLDFSNYPAVSKSEFNITNTETVSTLFEHNAGTLSGKIFNLQNNSFTEQYSSSNGSIEFISSNSALTSSGTPIIYYNNNWTEFSGSGLDSLDMNIINKIFTKNGTSIEIINSNFNYSTTTLTDSPTTIDYSISEMNTLWKISGTFYMNESIKCTLSLSDIDSNFQIPRFSLNGVGSILQNDSLYISNSIPDRNFSSDTSDFSGSKIFLNIDFDEITITLNVRKKVYNPISYKYSWNITTEQVSFPWSKESELSLSLNGKYLYISQESQVTNHISHTKNSYNSLIKNQNNALVVNNNMAAELNIYTLNGRSIFNKKFLPGKHNINLSKISSNQILLAVLFLENGNILKKCIAKLK